VLYVSSVVYMIVDYVTNRCSPKNGTFGTLQMLLSQEVDVIFGPVCSRGKSLTTVTCVREIKLEFSE